MTKTKILLIILLSSLLVGAQSVKHQNTQSAVVYKSPT